jgi:hypothetical protein
VSVAPDRFVDVACLALAAANAVIDARSRSGQRMLAGPQRA